ncbi:hypothetical protein AMECASPLE_002274, partial [Ameca splendens]
EWELPLNSRCTPPVFFDVMGLLLCCVSIFCFPSYSTSSNRENSGKVRKDSGSKVFNGETDKDNYYEIQTKEEKTQSTQKARSSNARCGNFILLFEIKLE